MDGHPEIDAPERLEYRSWGWMVDETALVWEDGTLRRDTVSWMGPGQRSCERLPAPRPEAWQALKAALHAAGFWRWPRSVADPQVCDGGGWELAITWGGRRKRISRLQVAQERAEPVWEALEALVPR